MTTPICQALNQHGNLCRRASVGTGRPAQKRGAL